MEVKEIYKFEKVMPTNQDEKDAIINYEVFNISGIVLGIANIILTFFWFIYILPYNFSFAFLLAFLYVFILLMILPFVDNYLKKQFIKLYIFIKNLLKYKKDKNIINNTLPKNKIDTNINVLNLYNIKPQKHTQTTQVYERNQELKNICINRANFQCEIDNNHKSFISSKQHNYVEAHHIIPLSFQNKFDVNLDSLENLISLCPICHKAIHNGSKEEKLKILKSIHIIRQPFNISFEELKRIYNI